MDIRFNYQAMLNQVQAEKMAGQERRVTEVATYDQDADKLGRDDVVNINGENWLVDDVASATILGKNSVTEYKVRLSQPLIRT